jgi:uncharacterized repeat protein (TIGR04076 family)
MEHRVKVTVIDKKLFPDLQKQYLKVPDSGKCPCFYVGDEFVFQRNGERDDYWHCGAGTRVRDGRPDEGCLQSPGTMHCGDNGVPFCAEAWDAISRYIYTGLQGGSIMHDWTNDDRVMIACCNDGTRPVIFKIERMDIPSKQV